MEEKITNIKPLDPGAARETERKAELNERLAAANALAEQVREKREQRETASELERRVLKAEQDAKDSEALLELEAEYGAAKIKAVETDLGIIVLKRCHSLRFKKFQDLENAKTMDVEKLVRPCVIYPGKPQFDAIIEELPATIMRCGNAIAELSGVRSKETAGK